MQLALDTGDAPVISFEVAGVPVPQGSKVARVVGKRIKLRSGKYAVVDPKVILTEQSDMQSATQPGQRLVRWREHIVRAGALAWREAMPRGAALWDCGVELSCEFVIPRPDGDWTSAGALRKSARAEPSVKPDLSKLVRAVEDALSGVVYRDDSRIVAYGRVWKRYAAQGGAGGVRVQVRPITT